MDKSGKIWGYTSKIFSKNNVEIHRIEGIVGGKSSLHRHTAKWSMFFVEEGLLRILIEKNDYPLTDETKLSGGESIIIQPKEYHSFEILQEGTVAYEIYWTEIDGNDIERKNSGSK
jgi:mannose-6-phosphate isomerase-like protein (cupin superfamily)